MGFAVLEVLFRNQVAPHSSPTENGELWVFNKTYTQYLPASIYDIQGWVGSPTIFVYDCSGKTVQDHSPVRSADISFRGWRVDRPVQLLCTQASAR